MVMIMKRDPKERFIKIHMDSITVKKIKPLLFWYKCEKCKKEFVREPMYSCSYLDDFFGTSLHILWMF